MRTISFLLGALVAASCGGSNGDPQSAAMFVGTWTSSVDSAEVEQCGTGSHTTPLWATVPVVLTAPNSGEIITQPSNGCDLTWVCNGNVATLAGTQTCTVPGSEGGTWQATFTQGTLTLGGNQIALQDKGTAVLTLNGGMQNCSFTQSGSFTKN